MAKQIKTVKCPQCGSINKKEISKDTFVCNDCGAKYYIDNDDININITENKSYQKQQVNKVKPATIVTITIAIITLFIIPRICSNNNRSQNTTSTFGSVKKSGKEKGHIRDILFLGNENSEKAEILVFDARMDGDYVCIFDLLKKKVVKETLTRKNENYSSNYFYEVKEYYDAFYVNERIDKQNRILKIVDPENLVFEDMADNLEKNFSELSGGVATLKFVHYSDGIEILTNDGLEYVYSTYSNKLYKDDKEKDKDASIPTYNRKYHGFTEYSHGCSKEKGIQLIELDAVSTNKQLKEYRLSWNTNCSKIEALWFNGSYKFSKDVTPDRKYFKADDKVPKVIYSNEDEIFVMIKASANPASKINVQCISAKTGDIKWAAESDLDPSKIYKAKIKEYKNMYIVYFDRKFYSIEKENPTKLNLIPLSDDFW